MMNMAPIFHKNNLHLCTYAESAALRDALLQRCYSSDVGASSTTSAEDGTVADVENRMQVDFLKKSKARSKSKHQNQKSTRANNPHANTCKNCGRTGPWVKDCWRPSGRAHDNSNNNRYKKQEINAKANKWTWCRGISLPKQPPLFFLHRHQAPLKLSVAIQTQQKGWIMTPGRVTISSLSSTIRCTTSCMSNQISKTNVTIV